VQASTLESRPLYAIGTVARLTGIKPDTLRIWERRYGLGASHRSATGRRQYTQADLEHLQLLATMVGSGIRIGQIAACGRKTLEILLNQVGGEAIPVRKPRVVAIGAALCQWLDEHQGCLSHVDGSLARISLAQAETALAGGVPAPDLLVVGCEKLAAEQVQRVHNLAGALGATRTLVVYEDAHSRSVQSLQERGVRALAFPPDPGFLAFELAVLPAELASREGGHRLGDMVTGKRRQLSMEQLAAACGLRAGAAEISPARMAALVNDLARLEEGIAAGPVGDWSDAAVRACAYVYVGQARWLMEKALQIVLSQREGSAEAPKDQQASRLDNAA